jgi:hypothetical protein
MKIKAWMVAGAIGLGVGGFGLAWYKATTSKDVELAKAYLVETPEVGKKYPQLKNPLLVGFRVYAGEGGRSYCTFLVSTSNGYKLVRVVIDKQAEPWRVREVEAG